MKSISVDELAEIGAASKDIVLIDVRTPSEFEEVHVDGAENMPLGDLDPQDLLARDASSSDAPVCLLCRTGARARKAGALLEKARFKNVAFVEDGLQAWQAAGYPVVRGKTSVSLERQVRIAAGTLVALGVLLGHVVNLNWIWLSGCVGAGLIFSGVTDTCGMGLLLAKMPWNRRSR